MADDGERSVNSVSSDNPNGAGSSGQQGATQSQSPSAHFGSSSQLSETSRQARPGLVATQSEGYGMLTESVDL